MTSRAKPTEELLAATADRELLCDVMAASDPDEPTIPTHLMANVHDIIIEIDRAMATLR